MKTDAEIISTLGEHLTNAVGAGDGELSNERQLVNEYYRGLKPYRIHRGQSSFVACEVYGAVETLAEQITETFLGNTQLVKFKPRRAALAEQMRSATAYCSYVIHDQNDACHIFNTVVRDALMARVGVVKVYWQPELEVQEETIEGVPPEQVVALEQAEPSLDTSDLEFDEETGLMSGPVYLTVEGGRVMIDPVAPEDFLISGRSRNLKDAEFITHRTQKSFANLVAEGYPEKVLRKIGPTKDGDTYWSQPEEDVRFYGLDDGGLSLEDTVRARQMITTYESYIWMPAKKGERDERWQIIWAGDQILSKERVSDHPFVAYVPIPIPHSFWGMNFAKTVIPTQNAKTALMRSIMDHTAVTTNPRYLVLNKAVNDPQELRDNRLGGIVNVNRPDAVTPMVQPPLNPFVERTLATLDMDLQNKIGVSSTSKGLNKDALSGRASAALHEDVKDAGMLRQKGMARRFAREFLVPLYKKVYQLVLENERRERIIEVAGVEVTVTPSQWEQSTIMETELALGYGEQEAEAERAVMLHNMVLQDPEAGHLYPVEKRYNALARVYQLMGTADPDTFLNNPAQVPPPPNPVAELEMQAAKLELEIRQREMALKEAEFNHKREMDLAKARITEAKELAKANVAEGKLDLEEREHEHDKKVDIAEVRIMEKQAENAAAESKMTTIVSPNS